MNLETLFKVRPIKTSSATLQNKQLYTIFFKEPITYHIFQYFHHLMTSHAGSHKKILNKNIGQVLHYIKGLFGEYNAENPNSRVYIIHNGGGL